MLLPKYKFYLGRATEVQFQQDKGLSLTDGSLIDRVGSYATTLVALNSDYIYPDYETSVGRTHNFICFYDSDRSFISVHDLNTGDVIEVPSDAAYYALTYFGTDQFEGLKDTDFIYLLHEAVPHYTNLSKKYTKENNQIFFRQSLEGKINMFGNDCDYIRDTSLETRMVFLITKYNQYENSWQFYFKGEFNRTDCKFNYDKKSCELKLTAIDAYTKVLNKYDNTYDLIKLSPALSKINMNKRALLQVYVKGSDSITNFLGGTYWEADVNEAIDNAETLKNTYYFSYIGSYNELEIKNAGLSDINGMYAGTNGTYSNQTGYSITCEEISDQGWYELSLKRNSDNKVLYRTAQLFQIAGIDENGNAFINIPSSGTITFNATSDNGEVSGSCIADNIFLYQVYQRLLCDVNSIHNGSGGSMSTYDLPVDDFVSDNRNYKKCIGAITGNVFITSRAVTEPTRFGMNDFGEYFTDKFIPATAGYYRPLPISRNSWGNASLWYVYDNMYNFYEPKLRASYMLKDAYSIGAAIKVMLREIDPSISHEETAEYSQFLYGSTQPLLELDRFYVFISPKSNVLKGNYDQAAQKAEITFESLMDMLRNCFKCYWYIEDGKFKIEHLSYFLNGGSYMSPATVQFNLTEKYDQFNKKRADYFQSEVEFDKSELSSRLEFGWMDDVTDLFGNFSVDIDSKYIQQDNTEDITIDDFTSDVDFMLLNPSEFSSDGFALLCPIKSGNTYELPIVSVLLKDEDGDHYTATIQNWYASWLYLIRTYMYDMPATSISMNSIDSPTVKSVKRCMTHTVEFFSENDPDEQQDIQTNIGVGMIDSMSINIDTRLVKADLVYEPY